MTARRVEFPGAADDLAGDLHLPPGEPRALAVFAHGFTGPDESVAAAVIAETLERRDIGVLRVELTGDVADVIAAARWLESEHGRVELLIGHGLGGAAVLAAAAELESVAAVATIGAPADAHGVTERVGELGCATLFCHAPLDNVVGVDNASQLFVAARHPKSFLSLDRADHLLSDDADARYAASVIAAWAGRFLEPRAAAVDDVAVTTRDGFATDVREGAHRFRADEPRDVGGTDTGPNPYDLLAAALGSCTSITLRMYADRKEWPVDAIKVRLRHSKIHAADCEHCDTTEGKIDALDREIELVGDLDDAQRQRMLEIADKCPVHRTLHSEIAVRTKLRG